MTMFGRWTPPPSPSPLFPSTFAVQRLSLKTTSITLIPNCSSSSDIPQEGHPINTKPNQLLLPANFCPCCRRHFLGAAAISSLPIHPSVASDRNSDYKAVLNRVHPPRPDWYEEFYARVLNSGKESYEKEIADYKSLLFSNLKGKAKKVLEIGIGTGPNLKYYAGCNTEIQVIGVDPNSKMEKYASEAAVAAGLPPSSFEFARAVGEAIPLDDASVDAVIGTLVLCSVEDVDLTLQEVKRVLKPGGVYIFVEHVAAKDGTAQRFLQNVFDPLQQTLADGCHLARQTGTQISKAGFSFLYIDSAHLSSALFINPHVYGMATK